MFQGGLVQGGKRPDLTKDLLEGIVHRPQTTRHLSLAGRQNHLHPLGEW